MGGKVSSPIVRLRGESALSDNTIYQAASDGHISVFIYYADAYDRITVRIGVSSPPSGVRARDHVGSANGDAGCSCAVQKGMYFEATNDSTSKSATVIWTPQK